ncbi:hypothetical protein HPB48_013122 [Haemaphysalis longicornis]|uniref:Uncharacterized protein n=1 Tax=Haemaphysalis longicornis TaxID=44386 RepID=A0A9J6GKW1_HAELO|nr:hypothetical protein HPB48_013122 [Haemaphysalis longicornis]
MQSRLQHSLPRTKTVIGTPAGRRRAMDVGFLTREFSAAVSHSWWPDDVTQREQLASHITSCLAPQLKSSRMPSRSQSRQSPLRDSCSALSGRPGIDQTPMSG